MTHKIKGNLKLEPGTAPTASKGVLYYDSATDSIRGCSDGSNFTDIVKLDNSGRLPMVDGSQLTSIGENLANGSIPGIKIQGTYQLSDVTLYAMDADASSPSNVAYTKVEHFTLPASFPANTILRIRFTMGTGGSTGTMYSRIYKNGVAFGTARSKSYTPATGTEYTEDLTFNPNDTIELWSYSTSGCQNHNTNFRISGNLIIIPYGYNITGTRDV